MRNRLHLPSTTTALAAVGALVLLTACEPPEFGRSGGLGGGGDSPLETEDQQASYAIGLNFGGQLVPAAGHIDTDALVEGLLDGMNEADARMTQQEIQEVMTAFNETITAEMQAQQEVEGAANREEGEAFLAENAERDGVTVTASGLQYEVIEEGDGPSPAATDRVRIQYEGSLLDGTVFDSSYERGQPAEFGVNQVISGFGEGLQLMSVGGHYRFYIPSDLAYGPQGSPPAIPPASTLIFEVELEEIL